MLPAALASGDAVALVSPCGPVLDPRLLDGAVELLGGWGLDVVEGPHARTGTGHLAGRDDQRVADLNAALGDPRVRAVWCTRGGYGLTRILDRVDWAALAADPKLLIGCSDVSALLTAAWRRLRLVTVHGHVAGRLPVQPDAALARLRAVLFGHDAPVALEGVTVHGGAVVRGPLVGGNLTVLAALAGTADAVDARGCVLLLEEVGEAPYRVDRLLTQLRASGALDGVAGVVVGAPVRCDPPPDRPSATFAEVIAERLGDLGAPVLGGVRIGHMPDQCAVLHGAEVTLDPAAATLTCAAALSRGAPDATDPARGPGTRPSAPGRRRGRDSSGRDGSPW